MLQEKERKVTPKHYLQISTRAYRCLLGVTECRLSYQMLKNSLDLFLHIHLNWSVFGNHIWTQSGKEIESEIYNCQDNSEYRHIVGHHSDQYCS
jgi:hypothetical protein